MTSSNAMELLENISKDEQKYNGNICIFGDYKEYFQGINKLKIGDCINYLVDNKKKTYVIQQINIDYDKVKYLMTSNENKITLLTQASTNTNMYIIVQAYETDYV